MSLARESRWSIRWLDAETGVVLGKSANGRAVYIELPAPLDSAMVVGETLYLRPVRDGEEVVWRGRVMTTLPRPKRRRAGR